MGDVTVILPPAAGAGAGGTPLQVALQTTPAPQLRALLPAPGGAGGGVPASVSAVARTLLPPAGGAAGGPAPLILFGLPAPPAQPLPAWARDVEGWAIARELQVHAQSLWQYGELAYFALMWHTMDLVGGLVQRCYRCWQGDNDDPSVQGAEQAIAAAYGQGNQYDCPVCYNTTYALPEGSSELPGVRALIIRPALFDDYDRDTRRQQRGVFNTAGLNIESTPDFRVRTNDYVFRADGTRYQLKVPRRITLRTGFAHPWQGTAAITYNFAQATLEDPLTVAYKIPPEPGALAQVMTYILGIYTRVPVNYDWAEVVNGPLIPLEAPDPAASGAPQPPVVFPLPGLGVP
jgi:hypothetical protein